MNSIHHNPFRVLGTISNASLKEVKSAEVTIKRYLDIGKSPQLKFDLSPPLKQINRSITDVTTAKNQIHSSLDKLINSVFWFISSGAIDDIALSKLTESKDTDLALETFRKGANKFNATEKSATCIINHSTLEILLFEQHQDENRVLAALRNKLNILTNKTVVSHLEFLVTGEKNKVPFLSIKEGVLTTVKTLISDTFPNKDQANLLLSILPNESEFKREIESEIVQGIINKITVATKKFDDLFDSIKFENSTNSFNKKKAISILNSGKELVENSKQNFVELLKYIDKTDYQFENPLNEVFSRANIAIINVYNSELQTIESRSGDYSAMDFDRYISDLEFYEEFLKDYVCDVKETIIKNLKSIRAESKGSICWFCETNPASKSWSLRIQMYKTQPFSNSYSYFKNGGVPVERCFSCSLIHTVQKLIAVAFVLAIYGAIAATGIGLLFIFGDLQNRFILFRGIYRWFLNLFNFVSGKRKGCGTKKLEENPSLRRYIIEGYSFSKPF